MEFHRWPRLGLLLLASSAFGFPAGAALISVTTTLDENNSFFPSGNCALREAIEAANSDTAVDGCAAGSGADVIALPAGTYRLSLAGVGEDANQTGDLDVTESVEIMGEGAASTVIEWDPAEDRILHVQCDASAPAVVGFEVRGVRLTGGGISDERGGAALLVEDCSFPVHATLEDTEIDTNDAGYSSASPPDPLAGGAIAIDSAGQITLRNTLVAENLFGVSMEDDLGSLGGAGLGMTGGGSLLIEDSHFRDNEIVSVFSSSKPSGSAIWTDVTTTIRGSTFHSNDNLASGGRGGALYCESALMTVENSTFQGNSASRGGAFGNGVDGAPGCIVSFDSVTVVENSAGNGGGIANDTGGVGITNSIIADNVATGPSPDDVDGSFTSGDYNLIGSGDGSTGFTGPNDLVGTVSNPIDPVLESFGSEGFAVPTRPPAAGSPALDSGGGTALTSDQRGLPRGALGFAPERGAAEVIGANYGIYLDVGVFGGTPASSFAAAATAAGVWNSQNLGSAPAVERSGAPTQVTIDIASMALTGGSSGATDPARLFLDGVHDCTASEEWSVDFTGLPNADYLVFVYAPNDEGVSTGEMLVEATPLASIPGDTLELDEGASFAVAPASVTDGTLSVAGSDAASPDCAGVAGLQLLPEPGAVGLWLGAVALAGLPRKRRARTMTGACGRSPEPEQFCIAQSSGSPENQRCGTPPRDGGIWQE